MDSLFEINAGDNRLPFLMPALSVNTQPVYFHDPVQHRAAAQPRKGLGPDIDFDKLKARAGDKGDVQRRWNDYQKWAVEAQKKYPGIDYFLNSQENIQAMNNAIPNLQEQQNMENELLKHNKRQEMIQSANAGQEFDIDRARASVAKGKITPNSFMTQDESMYGTYNTPGPTTAYSAAVGTMKNFSEDMNKLWNVEGSTTIANAYEYGDKNTGLPFQVGDAEKGFYALQKRSSEFTSNIDQMHVARDKNGRAINPLKMLNLQPEELQNIGAYTWSNLTPEGRAGAESAYISSIRNRPEMLGKDKDEISKNYYNNLLSFVGNMSLDEAQKHVKVTSREGLDLNTLGRINDGGANADDKSKYMELLITDKLPDYMKGVSATNAPMLKHDAERNMTFYHSDPNAQATTVAPNYITDEYINKLVDTKAKIAGAVLVANKFVPAALLTQASDASGTITKNLRQIQYRPNIVGFDKNNEPIVSKEQPMAPYYLAEVRVTADDLLNPAFRDEHGQIGLKGFIPEFNKAGSKEEGNREQFLISENFTGYTSVNEEFADDTYIRPGVEEGGYWTKGDYTLKVWIPFAPSEGANPQGKTLNANNAGQPTFTPAY